MARMVWIGIGAAGGVYVYRKGEQAMDRIKAEGVAGSAALLAKHARAAVDRLGAHAGPDGSPVAAGHEASRGLHLGGFRIARIAPADALDSGTGPGVGDTGTIDITDGAAATAGARRRRKVR